jgi:hypothetical protein
MIRPGEKRIAENTSLDEKRRRIPRRLLLTAALMVLSCGLCYLYASRTFIVSYVLNLPLSAAKYEPGRKTAATLWVDKTHYKQDEPIHIRFTVKNTSGQSLILERKDGPAMDLVIRFTGNTKPYRWSELYPDQMRTLQRLELQPNEERTIEWILKGYHESPRCTEVCGAVEIYGYWQWTDGELGMMGDILGYSF